MNKGLKGRPFERNSLGLATECVWVWEEVTEARSVYTGPRDNLYFIY